MTNTSITSTANISTVYFDQTHQEWLDLVDPATKLGVYSGRTKEELSLDYKATVVEMDRLEAARLQDSKHITPVVETTSEDYHYMLEVLPPCQWRQTPDFSHFYLSERISGSIVLYLVRAGKEFFKFQNRAGLSSAEIRQQIDQHLQARTPAPVEAPTQAGAD